MARLHIDIETRSRQDLKKVGVYRYVRCPDFKILMASWSLDGSPIRTALDLEEIFDGIPGLWEPDVVKVAHNAPFERVCFSQYRMKSGFYLPPEQFHDTMAVAAEYGYPQKLEKLAPALGASPKDSAGTRLINLFCKPNRAGGWNDHTTHPLEWLDFIAYCEQDVATLAEVDAALGDFPTETERAVYLADQRINDRGLSIDIPFAREAVRIGTANTEEQTARVRELCGDPGMNPKSLPQMHAWLESRGHELGDLKADTVKAALFTRLPPDVQEVLELRQELALAAPAKFASALATEVEGQLRGTFRFCGAHTGRWSGRGTQPHNMPRSRFEDEDGNYDEVAQNEALLTAMMGGLLSSKELKKLVRPMILGPLTVVDYASIEARVIAWLGGEEWTLQAALDGRDLYVETAERMGGLTRAQGKIAVLALGFGGGINSLKALAGNREALANIAHPPGVAMPEGEPLLKHWSELSDAEIDEGLQDLVYQWRNANPNIQLLWKKMDRGFRTGGPVGQYLVVERDGNDRFIRLPSGRALCYRKAGIKREMERDRRTGEMVERENLTFLSPDGRRVRTYGGKLSENVTQAVARDLLAEALVRLEERGYPVVGHTHDEILVEGEHDVDTISKIVCELPSWAAGLPVDGEGFVCQRYRKG